ncbi:hypothetical protein [Streptosporangium sp. NPDC051022]|uniref:hypothetical protein n=1 Tax=Streptosporangium sp. NPDC051022 TaxID=3155752 RepID=UPI00341A4922
MTEPMLLPTRDELDLLVDTDPLRLRDKAFALLAEVERLRTERDAAKEDATKWRNVEFEIERAADRGDLDAQDLLAIANGKS